MIETKDPLLKAPKMRIHFDVNQPVELVEMTLAFQALGFEYQRFLREISAKEDIKPKNTNDVKLYITKLETNCILADLAPAMGMLGALAPVMSDANNIVDFVKNTKSIIDWLISVEKKNVPIPTDTINQTKKTIRHFKDVVRLVGKNSSASLGLQALKYEEESGESKISMEIRFDDEQCRKAERGANMVLDALETTEKADKEKVLMYFYQTNQDEPKSTGRTGDKAVINSVTTKPLSVFFLSEMDQQRVKYVLDDKEHNPLHTGLVVDVNIETDPRGNPRLYRVLKVHDIVHGDE